MCYRTSKSDTALRTLAGFQSNPMTCGTSAPGGNTNTNQQTRTEKTRTSSGPPQLVSDDQALSGSTISGTTGGSNNMITTPTTIADNELLNQIDEGGRSMIGGLQQQTFNNDNKLDITNTIQPHPLPMPEYGGYFAPLTEYLPDSSQPISGFHR